MSITTVDKELLEAATLSLQAQERLTAVLHRKLKTNEDASSIDNNHKEALSETGAILDSLRDLKSRIEGTLFRYKPVTLDSTHLSQLKHLVVSHTLANLHDQTKSLITENLSSVFKGQVKQLLFACVLTCPWFARAQAEVSGKGKNNLLYAVFVGCNEHFFSLTTHHEKGLNETIDEGCLFACEIRRFCQLLRNGNVRSIEAFCCPPQSLVFETPEWVELKRLIDPASLLHKSFVESCEGQGVCGISKKQPSSGVMVVKDDTTLVKFCDSFRLLSYALAAINQQPIVVYWEKERDEDQEIVTSLERAFDGCLSKDALLQLVLGQKERLRESEEQWKALPKQKTEWTAELSQWLSRLRLKGLTLSPVKELPSATSAHVRDLLVAAGVPSLTPEQVLVVAKAGSRMYNLATPTSDTDYIVVYRDSTEKVVSSCSIGKESFDNKGKQAATEVSAYEARLFCEVLLKGAVTTFELLYSDHIEYSSDQWRQLVSHRELFMSEKLILQYIGFVKTHMKMITKHKGTPRERKLLYQIYHKLMSLESFVKGGPPVVWCEGDTKDFIMRIRTEPLKAERADELLQTAERRLQAVRDHLLMRTQRFPEYGDYTYLLSWLLDVRGVTITEPLRMALPPLTPSTQEQSV